MNLNAEENNETHYPLCERSGELDQRRLENSTPVATRQMTTD